MEHSELVIGLGLTGVLLWYLDKQGVFNHVAASTVLNNASATILPQVSIAPTGVSTAGVATTPVVPVVTIAPPPVVVAVSTPPPVMLYKDQVGPVPGTTNQDWIGAAGSVLYPARAAVANTSISPLKWNTFRQQSGASGTLTGAGLTFPYVQNGLMYLSDFHAALRLEGKE